MIRHSIFLISISLLCGCSHEVNTTIKVAKNGVAIRILKDLYSDSLVNLTITSEVKVPVKLTFRFEGDEPSDFVKLKLDSTSFKNRGDFFVYENDIVFLSQERIFVEITNEETRKTKRFKLGWHTRNKYGRRLDRNAARQIRCPHLF